MMFLAEVFVEMMWSRQEPAVGLPDSPTDSLTLKAIVLLRELLLNKKQSWRVTPAHHHLWRKKDTILSQRMQPQLGNQSEQVPFRGSDRLNQELVKNESPP